MRSARVMRFFQHGGVVGVTREVKDSPGFTRLFARMLSELAPFHTYTEDGGEERSREMIARRGGVAINSGLKQETPKPPFSDRERGFGR